ncbi:MAG: hypothetical protein ACRCXT_11030 [Paraclostridium sp.]
MAVYSKNRTSLGNYDSEEIVANENYSEVSDTLLMVMEGAINDQIIFENVIGMDFQEVGARHQGMEVAIEEAAVGGFVDKVKEFLKKAWEKLKGIFKSFLAKLDTLIMRDNKAFVEKYKAQVMKKNLSKMKYKWADPKNVNNLGEMRSISVLATSASEGMVKCKVESSRKKEVEIAEDGTLLDNILTVLNNNKTTDVKSFNKDFRETLFNDIEVEEGLNSSRLQEIMTILCNKKLITNVEKSKKEIDKYFSKLLNDVDKESKRLSALIPDSDKTKNHNYNISFGNDKDDNNAVLGGTGSISGSDSASDAVAIVNAMYKVLSVHQTAINMYTGRTLAEVKNHVAQCRAVFNKAVSFNPKAIKEDAVLFEAAYEAGEYEVLSSL